MQQRLSCQETLTTKQAKFGSRCELSEDFLSQDPLGRALPVARPMPCLWHAALNARVKVSNCGIIDLILMAALAKSKVDLGKRLKARASCVRLTRQP